MLTIDFAGGVEDGLVDGFWTPYQLCAMFKGK